MLRRKRSLEAAAASAEPRALAIAALVQVQGLSGRALETMLSEAERPLVTKLRTARTETFPPAVHAELPDWLWERLVAQRGFDASLVDQYRVVRADTQSACGAVLRLHRRVIVEDLAAAADSADPDGRLRACGIAALQSTPLCSQGGKLLGAAAP